MEQKRACWSHSIQQSGRNLERCREGGVKGAASSFLTPHHTSVVLFCLPLIKAGLKKEKERNRNTKAEIQGRDLNMSSPPDRVRQRDLGELPIPGTGLAGIHISLPCDWEGKVALTSCWAQSQGGWA